MSGNYKPGFTIIEIMVVIAIIGMLLTFVVPNVSKLLLPRREREVFISKLNAFTRYAWQHALMTRKVHKINFNFQKKQISLQMGTGSFDKNGEQEFAPVKGAYINTTLAIPANIKIGNFIVEGFDEMARGKERSDVWFFIIPDGMAQAVTINFVDTKQVNAAGKSRQFGLVLNPFNAQFKVYDSFQK